MYLGVDFSVGNKINGIKRVKTVPNTTIAIVIICSEKLIY